MPVPLSVTEHYPQPVITIHGLGAVAAGRDGEPLDLGGPAAAGSDRHAGGGRRPGRLGGPVRRGVWSGQPPPKALGALQAYVSHLRRVLEPERRPREPARVLVSSTPGYRLVLPPRRWTSGIRPTWPRRPAGRAARPVGGWRTGHCALGR